MYGKMYSVVQYSSSLTSEPLLYEETKLIAKLKLSGATEIDIRKRVIEDNLFNYKSIKQASRMIPVILRRMIFLDDSLADTLVNGDEVDGKLVTLYLVMKNNILFDEFISEVYMNKVQSKGSIISKADITGFFDRKSEDSTIVAKWQPKVVKKLGQVYIKILYDAGLLDNTSDCNVLDIDLDLFENLDK